MIELTVIWHRIGYPGMWFSRYERGESKGKASGVDKIYRHKKSGQVRVYSDRGLDGRKLRINGDRAGTLRPRGRFGKLYLGF